MTIDGRALPAAVRRGGRTGLGKPLKASIHPLREDIPIFLGAEGPKNIALAAELCDGWLAMLFSPRHEDFYRDALSEGFAREGARRSLEDFEVVATVPLIVNDDVEAAADMLRPLYALYFGGHGGEGHELPRQRRDPHGLRGRWSTQIEDLYLAARRRRPAAAIPTG